MACPLGLCGQLIYFCNGDVIFGTIEGFFLFFILVKGLHFPVKSINNLNSELVWDIIYHKGALMLSLDR